MSASVIWWAVSYVSGYT